MYNGVSFGFKIALSPYEGLWQSAAGLPASDHDSENTHVGATVRNPTPYYVTLFFITLTGAPEVNAGVVAPFATRQTDWCRHTVRCTVRWQSINDYGRVMPAAQTVDLTRIH